MAELRTVMVGAEPPPDSGYVLIRYAPAGLCSATGWVRSAAKETTPWTPSTFASLGAVLSEACLWADANGVAVVYFEKGSRSTPA